MQVVQIETPGIAHYAYLIEDNGEAAIVDPRRDVQEYFDIARSLGARIKYVIETHRQEDFVMGSSHLAKRAGAQVVNGTHELFGHGDLRLADGQSVGVGSLTVKALHTPGHTPESMCYAVYADQSSESAWCVFTGDTLFFGTAGRTDLSDPNRAEQNAALLYDSVHDKLGALGDTAAVCPAHGPGSVCGNGIAPRAMSTLGDEKRYNKVFTQTRDAFARSKAQERMPRPPYFRYMEEVNLRGGIAPVIFRGDVALLQPSEFAKRTDRQIVIDAREPEGFAGGHIESSYAVWLGGMPVFGGWVGSHDKPVFLVTERDREIDDAALHLTRIGIDSVQGALAGGFGAWRKSGLPVEISGTITPRQLAKEMDQMQVLDVREIVEFEEGHMPKARHVYVGALEERLRSLDLDRSRPVVTVCSVGHRAGLAASILLRHRFADVRNLLGGMTAWNQLDLPRSK